MRVLHVIDSLRVGGAEALLAAIVRELQAARLVESFVSVVSDDGADPGLVGAIRGCGADLGFLGGRRLYDPRIVGGLAGELRRRAIDVVHSHLCVANANSRLAARSLGRRHVTTIHTPPGPTMEDSRRCALADGLTARLSHALVAPSPAIADTYRSYFHLPAGRMRVIPNGPAAPPAAATDRAGARAEILGSRDGPLIVCVARLQPEKGVADLIDAAAELSSGRPDMRVAIVGAGPEESSLRRRIADLGLAERVLLLGHRSDVPRILAAADAFCLPSHHEGLPISLLEAMAAALPCVATEVGGIPAAVTGECALLVAPGDPAALAGALERILGDGAFARELGERARRRVEGHYSIGAVARRYADLYAEVLDRGRLR